MQKKVILALLMTVLLASGVFAEGFTISTGAGGLFDFSGNNGIKSDDGYFGVRILTLGAYAFFDVTYAELDVSYAYGKLTTVSDAGDFHAYDSRVWQLGLTLLGKYPVELGDFTVFPLLGFNYNVILSHIVAGNADPEPGKWSQLGILAGVGADFDLTDSLYLRGEGLFHLRLPNTVMKDWASAVDGSTTLGMGPRMKLGLGYRF
jgi:opacity protein-like surface antigen